MLTNRSMAKVITECSDTDPAMLYVPESDY